MLVLYIFLIILCISIFFLSFYLPHTQ